MKNFRLEFRLALVLFAMASLALASCETDLGIKPGTTSDEQNFEYMQTNILDLPYEAVSDDEISSLVFMREEEKLARDVYIKMYELYGEEISFNNISKSELRHANAILQLLDKYKLEDPVADIEAIGVFQNADLQELYNSLIERGEVDLTEALKVGAEIEEIDILDLMEMSEDVIDNEDILFVYSNLLRGSRNHLRRFTSNLLLNEVTYDPIHLDQDVCDSILEGPMERGNGRGMMNGTCGAGNERGNANTCENSPRDGTGNNGKRRGNGNGNGGGRNGNGNR